MIIIYESGQLHTPDEDVHDLHPILKQKLSPGDKCWKTEEYQILQKCDLCSGNSKLDNCLPFIYVANIFADEEIEKEDPLVCVAKGKKELVECKKSGRQTYRRYGFMLFFGEILFKITFFYSCDTVDWIEEQKFWTFEGLLTLLGVVSGAAVFIRQKQLDHRMYQRIQKQIASGV